MSSLARKFRIKFDDKNLVFDETYPMGMEQYLSEPEFEAVLRKINEELNQDALAIKKEVQFWGGVTAATAIFVVGLILSPVLYVKLKRQERIMTAFRKAVKEHLTESTKLLLRSGKKLMRWELVSNKKGNRERDVVNTLYDMAIEFQVKRATRVAGGRKVQQQQEEEEEGEEGEEEEEEEEQMTTTTTSYSTPNEPSSAEAGSETSDVLGELPSSQTETSASSAAAAAALFANTGRHNPKRVSFVGDTSESSGGGTSPGSARGTRRRLRRIAGLTAGTAAAAALLNRRRRERQNMSDEEDAGRRESAVSMASVLLVDKRASTESVESVPLVEDEKRASTGSVQSMEIGDRSNKTASMMPISFADKRASTMTTSSIATVPAAEPEAVDTSRMSMLSITSLALAAGALGATAGLATVDEQTEEEEAPSPYGRAPIVNAAPSPAFPNADAINHPARLVERDEEKALSDIIEETEEEEEIEAFSPMPFVPLGAAGLGVAGLGAAGAFAAYPNRNEQQQQQQEEEGEKASFEGAQNSIEEEEASFEAEERNSYEEEQEFLQVQQQEAQHGGEDPFKDQPQDRVNSYEQDYSSSSSATSSTSRGEEDSISSWTAFLSSSAAGFSTQTSEDAESLRSIQQSLSEADSGSIASYPTEREGSDESSIRETFPHSQSNSGTDFWGADSSGESL
jgi:hypothetical protein